MKMLEKKPHLTMKARILVQYVEEEWMVEGEKK
jgi:hypothetical protein